MKKFIAYVIWITGIVIVSSLCLLAVSLIFSGFYFLWRDGELHVVVITLAALAVTGCIGVGCMALFDWAKRTIDS